MFYCVLAQSSEKNREKNNNKKQKWVKKNGIRNPEQNYHVRSLPARSLSAVRQDPQIPSPSSPPDVLKKILNLMLKKTIKKLF